MTVTMIRREDERLLTGKGQYTADTHLPGQLHAYVLRSDRPHADIAAIDTADALAHPGVHLVLTGSDMAEAGYKSLPGGAPWDGVGGQKFRKPHYPALALGRVRFVGQPVALVVADSVAGAQDASEKIRVDYRDRPAAASFEDATRPGAALLHDEIPGNLAFDYETGDSAAVEAAFAQAAFMSRLRVDSQRLVGSPIEPRAFVAAWDAATDTYTVHTPSQGMNGMRAQLAEITGVPGERIRVLTADVGGSFGLRGFPSAECLAVMLAAKRLGQPVKWTATRAELFLGETHGRAISLGGQLALDREGRFLAIRFDDHVDLGAYTGPMGAFLGSRNITITMGGVYRIPAMYARARLAFTNTTPVSSYRGAGRPDIAYAIERLVDYAAAEHGFDPVELRRKNFVPPEAMPYKTANGTATYDCGEFEKVMDKALVLADWKGFASRREASARAGRLRGIGLATFLEAAGAGTAPKDQVQARFDERGDLWLYTLSQSSGQGHETTFAHIVAAGLGLGVKDGVDRMRLREGDPDTALIGSGTGGSRSLLGAGSAFKLLAPRLIETASPHAAAALGVLPAEIEYRDGSFHAGGKRIGFFELAERLAANPVPHPMDCMAEGSFGMTFPNGCHIAEVEIEPATGELEIVSYTAVDDVGNVVDHASVEGQVHGGVLQGVGQVLGEHAIYDRETGQLLTGSFMDYPMPRADLMPRIRCAEHSVPTKANVLGAKGVGESGCTGALPSVMNAIVCALRPLGLEHLDMPTTPDRLWHAIRDAQPADSRDARGAHSVLKRS